MKTRTHNRAIGALAIGLAMASGTPAAANPGNDDAITIDVIINILKGSGVTEAEAKKYLKEANKNLKGAKIQLQSVKINTDVEVRDKDDDGAGNNPAGDNDGDLSRDEFDEAVDQGNSELNDASRGTNKGRGLKVYFGNDVWKESPNTNGWAYVCQQIAVVEEVDGATNCAETGNILAHEVGHCLGVPGSNDPNPMDNLDGDYTDASRKNELMNGWSSRQMGDMTVVRGSDLTDAQKNQMRCKAAMRSRVVKKPDPATPAEPRRSGQSGIGFNDETIEPLDTPGLREASMFALETDDCFQTGLITRRPQGPAEFAQYTLLFDIDNDPATGEEVMGVPGVERVVDIFSEFPGFALAQGFDTQDFANPVFFDVATSLSVLADSGSEGTIFSPEPAADIHELCIPRAWLGVDPGLADVVPVLALAPSFLGPPDLIDFPLDLGWDTRGPELLPAVGLIDPFLGEPVPLQGLGFPPGALIELSVPELDLTQPVPVMPDGTFQVELLLPPLTPTDFYFINAFDPDTQLSGFTLIDVANSGPQPCSPADLAPPFGIVDIDDVDAFILAFLTGDAAADLVPPFGITDIDDVDAFIALFLAGCP